MTSGTFVQFDEVVDNYHQSRRLLHREFPPLKGILAEDEDDFAELAASILGAKACCGGELSVNVSEECFDTWKAVEPKVQQHFRHLRDEKGRSASLNVILPS
ncbi:hypothetical protein B7Y92_03075 [Candidatus Saccharibacteria bacterium 32-50-13]|nr:MAG: hypothetical protein B7Y92_03075 [Candidatus Saccharibacteria bacterium 32-50-13]